MPSKRRCTKCKNIRPKKHLSINNGNKDGLEKWCRSCWKEYRVTLRQRKLQENPYFTLLIESCRGAFERGQPNYSKSGYKDVLCAWSSPKQFAEDLANDEEWMSAWKAQTDVYLLSDNKNDRPSIDRIDSSGNYERSNIRVLPLGQNMGLGGEKGQTCDVMFIRDKRIVGIATYESISKTARELGSTASILNVDALNTGEIYPLSNGYLILVQSRDGEVRGEGRTTTPRYLMVVDRRLEKFNLSTGETIKVLDRQQYKIPVGAIAFNLLEVS